MEKTNKNALTALTVLSQRGESEQEGKGFIYKMSIKTQERMVSLE